MTNLTSFDFDKSKKNVFWVPNKIGTKKRAKYFLRDKFTFPHSATL